jgi:chromosomal replication initiator protein
MHTAEYVTPDSPDDPYHIAQQQWIQVQQTLQNTLSLDAYQRWFRNSSLIDLDDQRLTIGLPNEIHLVWIETNYLNELSDACNSVFGTREIKLAVCEIDASATSEDTVHETSFKKTDVYQDTDSFEKRLKVAGLHPQFNFARFVVGSNSEFAHAASTAVAKNKNIGYNPLFIHGGPGLGKTHLMQAIGQEWLRTRPQSRVVFLTCEKFTNDFIDSVRKGDIEKFRKRYRTAELMLIDDVQFIAGKERSQEEFFHTFNTLLDGQRQVVLTSDLPACEIKSLEPRLVSRFECGLTVELQIPLEETRTAILRSKMEEWKVKISDEIITFLAHNIRNNVRRLEGSLMRIATYTSLSGESIPMEKVEYLLRDILREEATRQVTVDAIQKAVAEYFDLRIADMTSRRRPASIAYPRQIAMYLSRQLTKSSLMDIGEAFGGRDHGTVIHACKKLSDLMTKDHSVKEIVAKLQANLQR